MYGTLTVTGECTGLSQVVLAHLTPGAGPWRRRSEKMAIAGSSVGTFSRHAKLKWWYEDKDLSFSSGHVAGTRISVFMVTARTRTWRLGSRPSFLEGLGCCPGQ